jgi:hypothetical protein
VGFGTTNVINMVVNLYEKTNAITIFDIPYPYFEGELSVSSAQRRT